MADKHNGITEENGAIVKRVTLTTIYHKVQDIEENQNKMCEKLDALVPTVRKVDEELIPKMNEAIPKSEEVDECSKRLDNHIAFCEEYRSGLTEDENLKAAYERGRSDVTRKYEGEAKKKLKDAMWFWAKILLPAIAILLGLIYFWLDKVVF